MEFTDIRFHERKNIRNLTEACASAPSEQCGSNSVEVPYVALNPDYHRVGKKLLQTDYSSVNNLGILNRIDLLV